MKRDRMPGMLVIATAIAAVCGCGTGARPSATPATGEATLTSAPAPELESGPRVRTGKVQRAGDATAEIDAEEADAAPLSAPKDSSEGLRPSDRRDPSRRGGFGSSWK